MATSDHSRLSATKPSTSKDLPLNRLPIRPFGLQAKPETTEFPPQNQSYQTQPFGFDITTMPLIQAKLTIGEPGDQYEQEADRVASEVVQRINAPQAQPTGTVQRRSRLTTDSVQTKPAISTIQRETAPEEEEKLQAKSLLQRETAPEEEEMMQAKSLLQRETAPEEEEKLQAKSLLQRETAPEEEEKLQAKSLLQRETAPEEEEKLQAKSLLQRETAPEEEEKLQAKSLLQRETAPEEEEMMQSKSLLQRQAGSGAASADLESSIEQSRGNGQPLQAEVRHSMEQAFGANFSGVQIHTDSQSNQLNQSVQARAFTTGQDIFFRQGEYQPQNPQGQELLAHELTHVVQQNPQVSQQSATEASLQPKLSTAPREELTHDGANRSDEEDLPEEERVEAGLRSESGSQRGDEEDLPEEERVEALAEACRHEDDWQTTASRFEPSDQQTPSHTVSHNPIVRHLQALSDKSLTPGADFYRQEIEQFQRQTGAGSQRSEGGLPQGASPVTVKQMSANAKTLRAKGGVSFPSYSQIIADSTVSAAVNQAWQNTKAAATPASRREEGFWILKNMDTGAYSVTATMTGPAVGPTQGATIGLGAKPADAPPVYTVASFHTHTPTTHRSVGRAVGPSGADLSADQSDDVAGVVYDYVAVSGGNIPAGHPLNSAAKLYKSRNKRSGV